MKNWLGSAFFIITCFLGCKSETSTYRIWIKNQSKYHVNLKISQPTAYGFPNEVKAAPNSSIKISEVSEKGATEEYSFTGIPSSILTVQIDSNKTLKRSFSDRSSYTNVKADDGWDSYFVVHDSLIQ